MDIEGEMMDVSTFDVLLGPEGKNSYKILRAKDEEQKIGVEVNYDSALLLDPLRGVENDEVL